MHAVVLAGGEGTRLRPLTYLLPKPLLPLAGVPMLEHILQALPERVNGVSLAVGYMAERIENYLATHAHSIEVSVVAEQSPLGTGGALRECFRRSRNGSTLVFNGDVISSLDVRDFLAFFDSCGADGLIALWEVEEPERFGVILTDHRGRVRNFLEKPRNPPAHTVNAGVYVLSPELLRSIPDGRVSLERDVFPRAIHMGFDLRGYTFGGFWADAGTPGSYLYAQARLIKDGVVVEPGADVHRTAELHANSYVYSGARVGKEAEISNCALFPGASIGQGARVRDSIVGWNTQVQPGADVEGAVLCRGCHGR